MIEIIFYYNNKDFKIEYNFPRKIKEIFEEFLNSQNLEKDDAFLIYKGEQVNLNTEMFIEEQFNLLKNKKKRLVFLVYKKAPLQIIFISTSKKIILKIKLGEKLQDVLDRMSLKARINLDNIFFLYNAESYTYEELKNKTVNDIITGNDKDERLMIISLYDRRSKTIDSEDLPISGKENIIMNDSDEDSDDSDDILKVNLLERNEKNIAKKVIDFPTKKGFYIKNFFILLIQFILIVLSAIVGFKFKLNEKLIEADVSLIIKYIPFLVLIFILCIIIMRFYENQNNKWLIIFHIFYPPFIIYYSFLFSSFIDSKYIIIGLSLVGLEIFSLLLNIFLKKLETKHFFLFATFLSLIGLIFFSIFWIKSWFPILFMSIFWLLSNGIYISIILSIRKYCETYSFFYSSLIFVYNIILGIILIILISNLFLFSQYQMGDDDDNEKKYKIFGTLLLQYAIISVFVGIGFSFGWNEGLREDFTIFGWLVGISTVINIVICICILNIDDYEGYFFLFSIIFHVPMMIIYIYGFSRIIENKYILSFVFILFFDFLSNFLCILFFSSHLGAIFSSYFYSNILCIILFHFFWLNNVTALIWLIVLSIITDIYLAIMAALSKDKPNHSIVLIASFNYGFFCFILYWIYLIYHCCDTILRKCGVLS